MADSIHAALEIKKMKKYERESYLFVLIDGLSHKRQEEDIKYYSNQCQLIGMRVFGIGLGIYPYKMKEFFDTFIYSINPGNLLKGLRKIFGELIKTEIELKMVCQKKKLDKKKLDSIFYNLDENKNFIFKELRKGLENVNQGDDVVDMFCNKEKCTFDEIKITSFNVEKNKDLEIYSKNILKTQRILIVMLWSYELNEKGESPLILPDYINAPSIQNGASIKNCIEYFGIEDYVVFDYESAIKELLTFNFEYSSSLTNNCFFITVLLNISFALKSALV